MPIPSRSNARAPALENGNALVGEARDLDRSDKPSARPPRPSRRSRPGDSRAISRPVLRSSQPAGRRYAVELLGTMSPSNWAAATRCTAQAAGSSRRLSLHSRHRNIPSLRTQYRSKEIRHRPKENNTPFLRQDVRRREDSVAVMDAAEICRITTTNWSRNPFAPQPLASRAIARIARHRPVAGPAGAPPDA